MISTSKSACVLSVCIVALLCAKTAFSAPTSRILSAAEPLKKAHIDSNGACETELADTDNQQKLNEYDKYCSELLLPIVPELGLPGALFLGMAIGNDTKLIIAPAFGVNGGASIPIIRPSLEYYSENEHVKFRLPEITKFYLNLIVSGNVALAGIIFPGDTDSSGDTATELAWSVGVLIGVEIGGVSFNAQGTQKTRIAGTLGIIAGYLGESRVLGDAFLVGLQPGLLFVF